MKLLSALHPRLLSKLSPIHCIKLFALYWLMQSKCIQGSFPCPHLHPLPLDKSNPIYIFAYWIKYSYNHYLMAGLLLIKIQNLRQPHCQAKKMMTPIPPPRNALIEHKWFCDYLFLSSICLLTCHYTLY